MDLIEQGMENGLKDLREQIQDLREGVLCLQVQLVSHKEFMSFQDKVMNMFASVESHGGPRSGDSARADHLQDCSISMSHGHS